MSEQDEYKGMKGAFGSKSEKNNINYDHPYAETILAEVKKVMRLCFMGSHLVDVSEEFNIPVKILKAKMVTGFIPDTGTVFVSAPPNLDKYSPRVLLDMCKGLREAEQHLLGFRAPSANESVLDHAAIIHAKNLDAISQTCRVVHELKNTDFYSVLLDELKKLGHSMVYKAYVDGQSDEDLIRDYARSKS